MTFASIFETFKSKKSKILKANLKECKKKPTEWTFSNEFKKKVIFDKKVDIEKRKSKKNIEVKLYKNDFLKNKKYVDIVVDKKKKELIVEQDNKNIEIEKVDENDSIESLEENIKKEQRLKENLKYLHATVGVDLINPSFETLSDEFKFLKIKKYELKKIKKENIDLIKNDEELKKSIENFQEKLIKRIEKYNYFIGVFLGEISQDDEDYFDLKEVLDEYNNLNNTKKLNNREIEILSIGKYSNVGETIMRYLLNNASKFVSGSMGWNSNKFESVEDWVVRRSLGIVEEFRIKYPEKNLVNVCCGMQIILDITNKKDLKIIDINNKNLKNISEKEDKITDLDNYKKYFDKILSEIFNEELNDAKKIQVIDIENLNTNSILSKEQTMKFRELKYMIGEIIGESSNSKDECLKDYVSRVVEEMFNKCKKNAICDDNEKRVFNKIFEL